MNNQPIYLNTKHGFAGTTSAKFAGLSTRDALTPLITEGYVVQSFQGKSCRDESRRPHVSHVVRLSHPNLTHGNEYRPEVILKNGNDGTAAFTLLAGMFRFACANGIVIGASAMAVKVRHVGDSNELSRRIMAGAEEITQQLPRLSDKVETWQHTAVNPDETRKLFTLGAIARWGDDAYKHLNFVEKAAERFYRPEDVGNNLWVAFNRAQEILTRGTMSRRGSIRALRGLDQSIRFNRTLWNVAECHNRGRLEELFQRSAHPETANTIHKQAASLALAS